MRYLSPDEETKLRTTPHEPEFDFTIATGLRRCNMYAATWQDVDLAARTLTIRCMKNGDAIKLPLNQDAMRALSIFLSRGDGTGRIVRNVAGFPLSFNAHWFVPAVRVRASNLFARMSAVIRSLRVRLRQAGVSLGNIAELVGHKGLAMTKRYAHLSISNLHEAVSRISNSTTVAPQPVSEVKQVAYVH